MASGGPILGESIGTWRLRRDTCNMRPANIDTGKPCRLEPDYSGMLNRVESVSE
jgi:hypothetical protein